MQYMTIGQLAKLADVNIETIRYYERIGLLEDPHRNSTGYRQYTYEFLDRLRFIKTAKKIGFTLKDIQELFSLKVTSSTACDDVRLLADEKILEIKNKINNLTSMKLTLEKLIFSCKKNELTNNCPILQSINPLKENKE